MELQEPLHIDQDHWRKQDDDVSSFYYSSSVMDKKEDEIGRARSTYRRDAKRTKILGGKLLWKRPVIGRTILKLILKEYDNKTMNRVISLRIGASKLYNKSSSSEQGA